MSNKNFEIVYEYEEGMNNRVNRYGEHYSDYQHPTGRVQVWEKNVGVVATFATEKEAEVEINRRSK